MRFGLQKTSLVDYPGHVAATLFTYGCPLRCPFCHNPELVTGGEPEDFIGEPAVYAFLKKRSKVLDGVCITGGEPLLHRELGRVIRRVREIGLKIKLDTSGMFPERLAELLKEGLVDYVAMDIKTTPERYGKLNGNGDRLFESVALLRQTSVAYEFRATAAPDFVDRGYAEWLAGFLLPEERFYFQQFRPGKTLDPAYGERRAYTPEELEELRGIPAKKERHALLRGA